VPTDKVKIITKFWRSIFSLGENIAVFEKTKEG
jgi:hypothetical protein